MPKINVDKDKYPEDNSHLPITLTGGERGGWWATRSEYRDGRHVNKMVFNRLGKRVIESLTIDDKHVPAVTVTDVSWTNPRVDIKCSCGYSVERMHLNTNGNLPSRWAFTWRGHADELAAPLHVFTATAVRVKHEWFVSTADQLQGLGADRNRYGNPISTQHTRHLFWLVKRTRSTKTNKVKKTQTMTAYRTLEYALRSAKNEGEGSVEKDMDVEWHYDVPAKSPSGEAANLLTVMDQADTLAAMRDAKKMAEDYLQFGDLVRTQLDELNERIRKEVSFDYI